MYQAVRIGRREWLFYSFINASYRKAAGFTGERVRGEQTDPIISSQARRLDAGVGEPQSCERRSIGP
jgi:hypothetical protein